MQLRTEKESWCQKLSIVLVDFYTDLLKIKINFFAQSDHIKLYSPQAARLGLFLNRKNQLNGTSMRDLN